MRRRMKEKEGIKNNEKSKGGFYGPMFVFKYVLLICFETFLIQFLSVFPFHTNL